MGGKKRNFAKGTFYFLKSFFIVDISSRKGWSPLEERDNHTHKKNYMYTSSPERHTHTELDFVILLLPQFTEG